MTTLELSLEEKLSLAKKHIPESLQSMMDFDDCKEQKVMGYPSLIVKTNIPAREFDLQVEKFIVKFYDDTLAGADILIDVSIHESITHSWGSYGSTRIFLKNIDKNIIYEFIAFKEKCIDRLSIRSALLFLPKYNDRRDLKISYMINFEIQRKYFVRRGEYI